MLSCIYTCIGEFLITACADGRVRVYDAVGGEAAKGTTSEGAQWRVVGEWVSE